jgi:hypothetical protein
MKDVFSAREAAFFQLAPDSAESGSGMASLRRRRRRFAE